MLMAFLCAKRGHLFIYSKLTFIRTFNQKRAFYLYSKVTFIRTFVKKKKAFIYSKVTLPGLLPKRSFYLFKSDVYTDFCQKEAFINSKVTFIRTSAKKKTKAIMSFEVTLIRKKKGNYVIQSDFLLRTSYHKRDNHLFRSNFRFTHFFFLRKYSFDYKWSDYIFLKVYSFDYKWSDYIFLKVYSFDYKWRDKSWKRGRTGGRRD